MALEDLPHASRDGPIACEIRRDEDCTRTQAVCPYCRHGRAYAETPGLVRSRAYDRAVALPSDNHRLAAQSRIVALLDRSVKRVHVDIDDFSHVIRRHELTHCLDVATIAPWKAQHNFVLHLQCLWGSQGSAILTKTPAEHASYVEQRAAPAHQAPVVRAVTNHVTFSTQDRVLQGNRIETHARLKRAIQLGSLHHITSPRTNSSSIYFRSNPFKAITTTSIELHLPIYDAGDVSPVNQEL